MDPGGGGGGRWAGALDTDSTCPRKLAGKCRTVGAKGDGTNFLLPREGVSNVFSPHGSVLKILRILLIIHSWMKVMEKEIDPPSTQPVALAQRLGPPCQGLCPKIHGSK